MESGPESGFHIIKNWVQRRCKAALPSIVMFGPISGLGHYAIAVGTGIDKIFLVDPSSDRPEGTLYNNWLRLHDRRLSDMNGQRVACIGPISVVYPENINVGEEWWLPRKLTDELGC